MGRRWSLFAVLLMLLYAPALLLGAATPPGEEVKEAREEFESIDTNKDGFITREEILEMEEVPEREEIDEFFSTYDTDGDGRVTFQEILNADDELRKAGSTEEQNTEL